nr:hypothetical protein [Providencia stuartii]ELR5081957.1 hypothetical protein [Providencia stuartii]
MYFFFYSKKFIIVLLLFIVNVLFGFSCLSKPNSEFNKTISSVDDYLYMQELKKEKEAQLNYQSPFSIIMIDYFKRAMKEYGLPVTDDLINSILCAHKFEYIALTNKEIDDDKGLEYHIDDMSYKEASAIYNKLIKEYNLPRDVWILSIPFYLLDEHQQQAYWKIMLSANTESKKYIFIANIIRMVEEKVKYASKEEKSRICKWLQRIKRTTVYSEHILPKRY